MKRLVVFAIASFVFSIAAAATEPSARGRMIAWEDAIELRYSHLCYFTDNAVRDSNWWINALGYRIVYESTLNQVPPDVPCTSMRITYIRGPGGEIIEFDEFRGCSVPVPSGYHHFTYMTASLSAFIHYAAASNIHPVTGPTYYESGGLSEACFVDGRGNPFCVDQYGPYE